MDSNERLKKWLRDCGFDGYDEAQEVADRILQVMEDIAIASNDLKKAYRFKITREDIRNLSEKDFSAKI